MRIALIGRTEILYKTAEFLAAREHKIALVITAKEAYEYTKIAENFKDLSQKLDAIFIQTSRIVETINTIKSLPPIDIAVSMNYTGIIPKEVIDCFRLGILNAHGGDLPRYRGNACQAWAILNGEKRIGLCIHRMIGGELDNGDIIVRAYLPIDHKTKVTKVWEWILDKTPSLFEEALIRLVKDPEYVMEHQSKDPKDALRCYPRRPEDGRINWNKSALEILRLINASNKPYAGAFCEFEGQNLIVWDAELVDEYENFLAVPGQITSIGINFIEVACGVGKLKINNIEISGVRMNPDVTIKTIRKRLS